MPPFVPVQVRIELLHAFVARLGGLQKTQVGPYTREPTLSTLTINFSTLNPRPPEP